MHERLTTDFQSLFLTMEAPSKGSRAAAYPEPIGLKSNIRLSGVLVTHRECFVSALRPLPSSLVFRWLAVPNF